jgi:ribosome-associated protein
MEHINFELRGDFIELDKLLKATGLAHSGGAARMTITEGQVQVDGQVELRKTAKIRAGQVVSLQGVRIKVQPDPLQD